MLAEVECNFAEKSQFQSSLLQKYINKIEA